MDDLKHELRPRCLDACSMAFDARFAVLEIAR
jgi:hypothetical protein